MNGPEHYKAAERLLEGAQRVLGNGADNNDPRTMAMAMATLAGAQVHATLAHAAATAAQTQSAAFKMRADWERAVG